MRMSASCKLLLIDTRTLLERTQWGGKGLIDQCPYCGKLRDIWPDGKHRAGCKCLSLMRRLDAALRQPELL